MKRNVYILELGSIWTFKKTPNPMGFFPHFVVSFLFWRLLGCRNISPTSSLLSDE
jgi:hypothetical protein